MAMSPRKMMAMSKDLAKAAKMMEGGKVKKMRGGGMAMKKMRGGGMAMKKMRGGGMAKKMKKGGKA
jgi:hypothetical protein